MNCPHYFVYLHYICSRQEAINLLYIIKQPPLLYHEINGTRFYSCQRRLYFQVGTERHCQSYPSNTTTGYMEVGNTEHNYLRCNEIR
jgi:hypothetical protein